MFSALFFINAILIVLALVTVAMMAYALYELFLMPNTPADNTAQSRDIQH
jgi:uncharacterized membrane protein YobD (UPF0266 family)